MTIDEQAALVLTNTKKIYALLEETHDAVTSFMELGWKGHQDAENAGRILSECRSRLRGNIPEERLT